MYQSKHYTCEEIDERLLKGYYDDAVSKGYSDTFEQFQTELASIKDIAKNKESIQANAQAIAEEKVAIIGTDRIADSAVTTDKLSNGAVTSEKIATSSFDPTLSVSGKIAPADVVGAKLNELDVEVGQNEKEAIYTASDLSEIKIENDVVVAATPSIKAYIIPIYPTKYSLSGRWMNVWSFSDMPVIGGQGNIKVSDSVSPNASTTFDNSNYNYKYLVVTVNVAYQDLIVRSDGYGIIMRLNKKADKEDVEQSINSMQENIKVIMPAKDIIKESENIFDKSKINILNKNLGILSSTSTLTVKSMPKNNIYLCDCNPTDVLIARTFLDKTYSDFGIDESYIYTTDGEIEAGTHVNFKYLGGKYNNSNPLTANASKCYLMLGFTDASYNTDENIKNFVSRLVIVKNKDTRPEEYIEYGGRVEVDEEHLSQELKDKINTPPPTGDYVEKNQGAGNAGKYLSVGADGIVTLSEGSGGGGADTSNCVKKEVVRVYHLGVDLLAGVSYILGNGWSKTADGFAYTKTANGGNLEFDFASVEGTPYILDMQFGKISPFGLQVRFSGGVQADPYNGGTHSVVGLIGNGGKLIIAPNVGGSTEFNSTLQISMHNIVDEASAAKSVSIDKKTISAGSMSNDLTGFWNIALGAASGGQGATMGKLVSGSRNVAIGEYAMEKFVGGERNIAIGTFAMENVEYGTMNIVLGADGMYYAKEAHSNIAIGNSTFGNNSHIDDTIPRDNVAVGGASMSNAWGAVENNVCIGKNAGDNMAQSAGSPQKNVAIGTYAGHQCTTENVMIGYRSGYSCTGRQNTFIGASSGGTGALVNAIAIGKSASATVNNEIVIGNSSNNLNYIKIGNKKITFNEDGTCTWENL